MFLKEFFIQKCKIRYTILGNLSSGRERFIYLFSKNETKYMRNEYDSYLFFSLKMKQNMRNE